MNIESYLFIRLAEGASTDLAEFVDWSRRFNIVAELPLTVTGTDDEVIDPATTRSALVVALLARPAPPRDGWANSRRSVGVDTW